MKRRVFKGDHPEVAMGLSNLTGVLESLGRASEALPLEVEALAMRQRLFPGDHSDVALSLNNLAGTLESLERASEALRYREDAYAMSLRLSSPDRWRWGTSLGIALLRTGRPGEAVEPLRPLSRPSRQSGPTRAGFESRNERASWSRCESRRIRVRSADARARRAPGDGSGSGLSRTRAGARVARPAPSGPIGPGRRGQGGGAREG